VLCFALPRALVDVGRNRTVRRSALVLSSLASDMRVLLCARVCASVCMYACVQFTPQYGDSFLEWLRLCLLVAAGFGTHDESQLDDENVRIALDCGETSLSASAMASAERRSSQNIVLHEIQGSLQRVDTKRLERRCVDAFAALRCALLCLRCWVVWRQYRCAAVCAVGCVGVEGGAGVWCVVWGTDSGVEILGGEIVGCRGGFSPASSTHCLLRRCLGQVRQRGPQLRRDVVLLQGATLRVVPPGMSCDDCRGCSTPTLPLL
jgi:hypothetical protein